ncbi:MAG: glycoside hydrolase family 44 protein, partial [Fibrella sp.]|nr:glycoside hydrolase family 44 protein [Armatimonadota bacterium]
FPKDAAFLRKTGTRLSRWGGNIATTHNWKQRIRNTGADWYFENFGDESTIEWVKMVQSGGSAAMIGIPMVDWTPKAAGLRSYSVQKYGKQQKVDPERPDAGNGVRLDGTPILTNDPNDAYVPLRDRPAPGDLPGTIYRSEWIEQLKAAFGSYPHFYEFDNEPEIWDGTHRDIHPKKVNYVEMRDKYLQMARLIQSIDPSAKIAGPTVCGWWFYWNSAAGGADKAAHGGVDYLPWWLGEIAAADRKSGKRTLDIFDIHAYGDYETNGVSTAEGDARKIRSPRGMWDPTFPSEGGIGASGNATSTQPNKNIPAIIPRFRAMVNAIYPGTQFAITEWCYWNDNGVVESLAEADSYGVFGREKVDIATRFIAPQPDTLGSLALEMYKDFAPLSVEVKTSLSLDLLTSYASVTGDGRRMTVMVINKDPKRAVTAKIKTVGFQPTQMVAHKRIGDAKTITTSAPLKPQDSCTFPPYSQTLLVLNGKAAPGTVNWSVSPDALMMITGARATLPIHVSTPKGSLKIVGIQAERGISMTASPSPVTPGKPGAIRVVAGNKPGFYRFTVTAKTPSGQNETQSGWIVIGVPNSLPAKQSR